MNRRPVDFLNTVPAGQLEAELGPRRDIDRGNPELHGFLGLAKVVGVNSEEHFYTLRIVLGTQEENIRVPIAATHPAAGARHFLGAMAEIGDYCFVDWRAQESSEGKSGTKTPIIVAWVIPGTWPGRDWLTTSEFPVEEFDFASVKNKEIAPGVFNRTRHKLRHMQPGNIVGYSSQGSDLVLDESVTLSNRRGNEILLRDEDQALVVRSLQQFHAMSGIRTYGGMVQRDARMLPATVFSDGKLWDGRTQAVNGIPLREDELPASNEPEGLLTPARILARKLRGSADGFQGRTAVTIPENMDPYTFLQRGGYIDASGFAQNIRPSDAVYGGKPLYRVASQRADNAASNPNVPTLTEFRVEMTHTSKGLLPVTEQTDGFDAERLPRTLPGVDDAQGAKAGVYMELVYGSVVGNDPFSEYGRQRYGLPLVGRIFDSGKAAPRLDPAIISANPESGQSPTPIELHMATLFRISPLAANGAPDTFWGVNKNGQFKANLSGPQTENSAEIFVRGGLKMEVGGLIDLNFTQGFKFASKKGDNDTNIGAELSSERGAVRIFGGRSRRGPEALGERLAGTGGGEADLPSVEIEAGTNALFKAIKKATIKGDQAEVNARSVNILGQQEVTIAAADRIGVDTKSFDINVVGKMTQTFAGPKDFLPTNGALDDKTYVTFPGMNAVKSLIVFGDRSEDILIGNHLQSIRIGNFAYTVNLGTIALTAGTSNVTVTPGTITAISPGPVALESAGGTAVLSGTLNASLIAKGGPAIVRGSAGVILSAPADFNQGPIITAGSLDPLTGLPYITWGMGAKAHLVTT